MTKSLQEAFTVIRALPDDEQDTIAGELMRLIELRSLSED
jgi:hypothetical protein